MLQQQTAVKWGQKVKVDDRQAAVSKRTWRQSNRNVCVCVCVCGERADLNGGKIDGRQNEKQLLL